MSEQFGNIPDELKERDQWLLWDRSNDTPRRPHWRGNFSISWSDPDEWHSFEEATEAAESVESWGIGYVTAAENPDYARGIYAVIDIDGAADENDRPKDWVPSLEPFADRGAYIEWSPSHNEPGDSGLHIPVVGMEVAEWWNDCQRDDAEHEGVDILAHKFCTFTADVLKGADTGNVVEYGEWVDDWLHEAYTNITGENPISGRNTKLSEVTSNHDSTNDEWLDEDVAAEALDHIDPDVAYATWKDIGMALANHFGTSRGGSLFKNWSRGGSKWDVDAETQADRIIRDAGGYGFNAATIVHHAKQSGWDASSAARDALTQQPTYKADADDVESDDVHEADSGGDDDDVYSPIERFDGGLRIWKETKDGEWYSEKLTNFWIDVDATLERDDGTVEYLLTIDPISEASYQVAVKPVVFNDKRKFESKVCGEGLSATFDGSSRDLNRLKEYVAQQDSPVRRATEHIGLHDDEWVVPDGTLTADGWTDDPETVFESQNTPLANKCSLTPNAGDNYDVEAVRTILQLLPKTRLTERFLPAMGWFYAAATRPYIQRWEGEFNILAVTGDSGAGKTATLETLWSCFGVGGDLLRADGTTFPKMRALATSNALPIIFDEYKPADMSSYTLDSFHSLLRTSTRGGIEEKGRPDGSVVGHQLLAPAVISGEQALRGTAEERRTLQTSFSRQASVGGTPESEAFARLTGGEIDGEFVDGCDLSQHAIAYYQWVLQQDERTLRELWHQARNTAAAAVSDLDISSLDDMRLQAVQTLIYGCRIYRTFATEMGVSDDDIPVGEREIERAVAYILNERTATDHVSNLDRLFELAARAAASGYLHRGDHFEIVHEREPDEELRIKLSLVYDQLRRYARDHDIRDADLLDSGSDYRSRIADAAEDDDSYIIAKSKQTRGLNRCVAIDTARAERIIDGFEMEMLRAGGADADPDADDGEAAETDQYETASTLANLDPSRSQPITFRARATSILDPKPWLQAEGVFQDDGGVARFMARGSSNAVKDIDEGDHVEVRSAMVTTNENGAPVVELIDGLTTVTSTTKIEGQANLNQTASTDGGEPAYKEIDTHAMNADSGDVLTVAAVAGETGASPGLVEQRLETLATERHVLTKCDAGYEVL